MSGGRGGIVVAALIALGVLALSGCGGLSRAELRRQTDVVAATSAEGRILANRVAADDIRDSFARVHAGDLADEMDHTMAKLQEADEQGDVEADLEQGLKQTIQLASDASDALQVLELNPADAAKASEASKKLESTDRDARKLSDSL